MKISRIATRIKVTLQGTCKPNHAESIHPNSCARSIRNLEAPAMDYIFFFIKKYNNLQRHQNFKVTKNPLSCSDF